MPPWNLAVLLETGVSSVLDNLHGRESCWFKLACAAVVGGVFLFSCEVARPPESCNTIPDRHVYVGETDAVRVCFVDPNRDPMSYVATTSQSSVAAAEISADVVTITGMAPGVAFVSVTATDAGGLQTEVRFVVVVPNRAPMAMKTIPPLEVFAGDSATVDISGKFLDPDGQSLSYAGSSSATGVAMVSLTGTVLEVAGTGKGVALVTVTATDPEGLAATQDFRVKVPNRGPVAVDSIPEQIVEVGDTTMQEVSGRFSDPDGDSLVFAAFSSDTTRVGVSVRLGTVSINAIRKGAAAVTVSATDSEGLSASLVFAVTAPNRPPVALSEIPAVTVPVRESAAVDMSSYFGDPDGDSLAYMAAVSDSSLVSASVSGTTVVVAATLKGTAIVTVTATDPEGLTATHEFTVVVPNRAPAVVGKIPSRTIAVGDSVTLELSPYFGDPDGDALSYAAAAADADVVRASVTGKTLTISATARGETVVTIAATDTEGLGATQAMTVIVPNRAPLAKGAISPLTLEVGDAAELDLSPFFSDPDGDLLTFAATASDSALVHVQVSAAVAHLAAAAKGETSVTITATDTEGLAATLALAVTVPNRAPVVKGTVPSRTLEADDSATLDLSPHFADPDGDPLVYAAATSDSARVGVSISGSAVTIVALAKGEAEVNLTATDTEGLAATRDFAVTVPNRAPAVTKTLPSRTVEAGDSVTLRLSSYFGDPDGDFLSYASVSSDPGVSAVSVAGAVLTVTAITKGETPVTVAATDTEGLTATQAMAVTVPNRAPLAKGAISPRTLEAGDAVELELASHFSDPDGDPLAFRASVSDGAVAGVSVAGTIMTVVAVARGEAAVTVTASDVDGLKATHEFDLTVRNQPPVPVGSIPDRIVPVGDTVELDVSPHFSDPDGDPLGFAAAASDTVAVTLSLSGATLVIEATHKGKATLTITAMDAEGLAATHTFTVMVPNRAPRAVGTFPARKLKTSGFATVDPSSRFADPDDDSLSFEATSSNLEVARTWVSRGEVKVRAYSPGRATVSITAVDPGGLVATRLLKIRVEGSGGSDDNRAPVVVDTIAWQSMEEGQARTLRVASHFEDPDGDDLTFAAASSDTAVATAKATGSNVVLRAKAEGSATAAVTARDPDGLSATLEFTVKVSEPPDTNRAPVAVETIARQSMEEGQTETLRVASHFEDPDGDDLTFAAASSDAAVATAKATGSNVVLHAKAEGTATVGVTARDPDGLSAELEFTVKVSEPSDTNRAPVAVETIARQSMEEGQTETLRVASHFEDPDGDDLTFAAASSDAAVATAKATGSNVVLRAKAEGTATVGVTARDPDGLSAELEFTVKVSEPPDTNRPPIVVDSVSPRIRVEEDSAMVNAASLFEDPDGDEVAVAARSSDTSVATTAVQGAEVTVRAVSPGDAKITITATDTAGLAATLDFAVRVVEDGTPSPICDRTRAVRKKILANLGDNDCEAVTSSQLASITHLKLQNKGLASLKSGDFSGLTRLDKLWLYGNRLSQLPADVFSGLSGLLSLDLSHNSLTTLPPGVFSDATSLFYINFASNKLTELPASVFSGLSSLVWLFLGGNDIAALPPGVFSGLSSLEMLDLYGNEFGALPADVFSGLTQLRWLHLDSGELTELAAETFAGLSGLRTLDLSRSSLTTLPASIFSSVPNLNELLLSRNELGELPDGVFRGLSLLKVLWLHGNSVNPMPIEVSLELTTSGDVKATMPVGAPFPIEVPVTVEDGTLSGDGTITIPIGEAESAAFAVTPDSGAGAATVDIGTLPEIPSAEEYSSHYSERHPVHHGYVLTRSPDLPLTVEADDEDEDDLLVEAPLPGGAGGVRADVADSRYATSIPSSRNTSWIRFSSFTPSDIGRWNAFLPEISPIPPARLLITAVRAACAKSLSPLEPPELISPARPM